MAQAPSPSDPQAVLFACGLNSVRSPMAAAQLRKMRGAPLYIASAGVPRSGLTIVGNRAPDPTPALSPLVVATGWSNVIVTGNVEHVRAGVQAIHLTASPSPVTNSSVESKNWTANCLVAMSCPSRTTVSDSGTRKAGSE